MKLSQFSSYLSKCKQVVSVNGSTSDHLEISCGITQGSVLGLLLFLIYINDLPRFYLFMSLLMMLTSFVVQVT